jgi:hypothetical protein
MALLRRSDLDGAVAAGILSPMQADALAAHFAIVAPHAARDAAADRNRTAPRFTFVHVLYYLGGMIAIGAMSLFMTLGWNSLGGWFGCICAIFYAMLALALGQRSHAPKRDLRRADGARLLGRKQAFPRFPRLHRLALDRHGARNARGRRDPALALPLPVHADADLGDTLVHEHGPRGFPAPTTERPVRLRLGAAQIRVALVRPRDDAARVLGRSALAFLARLRLLALPVRRPHLLGRLVVDGLRQRLGQARVGRRVFAVFGGLGIAFYLGDLSWHVFRDSLLFPFALSLLGLAIIALGVRWQRHEARWAASLRRFVPGPLRELIEARATH